MAKLGAITQLLVGEDGPKVRVVDVAEPGRADHRVDAVVRQPLHVLAGGVDLGEVDDDVGAQHR